jgi:hypothetical protein
MNRAKSVHAPMVYEAKIVEKLISVPETNHMFSARS